jgi:hypothetical protein
MTSPTSGGRSVDIVRSRTQTMEFSFSLVYILMLCVVRGMELEIRVIYEAKNSCYIYSKLFLCYGTLTASVV